jgi:hypothetical protein
MNRNALICRNSILREIPLQDLNMEESPFADGWNGWVQRACTKESLLLSSQQYVILNVERCCFLVFPTLNRCMLREGLQPDFVS